MAKKHKSYRHKKRLDLLDVVINLAAFLYWLLSFALIIIQYMGHILGLV